MTSQGARGTQAQAPSRWCGLPGKHSRCNRGRLGGTSPPCARRDWSMANITTSMGTFPRIIKPRETDAGSWGRSPGTANHRQSHPALFMLTADRVKAGTLALDVPYYALCIYISSNLPRSTAPPWNQTIITLQPLQRAKDSVDALVKCANLVATPTPSPPPVLLTDRPGPFVPTSMAPARLRSIPDGSLSPARLSGARPRSNLAQPAVQPLNVLLLLVVASQLLSLFRLLANSRSILGFSRFLFLLLLLRWPWWRRRPRVVVRIDRVPCAAGRVA